MKESWKSRWTRWCLWSRQNCDVYRVVNIPHTNSLNLERSTAAAAAEAFHHPQSWAFSSIKPYQLWGTKAAGLPFTNAATPDEWRETRSHSSSYLGLCFFGDGKQIQLCGPRTLIWICRYTLRKTPPWWQVNSKNSCCKTKTVWPWKTSRAWHVFQSSNLKQSRLNKAFVITIVEGI